MPLLLPKNMTNTELENVQYIKTLTHPEHVDSAHQLLMGRWNFLFNILVKAWLYFHELRQGRKVIDPL